MHTSHATERNLKEPIKFLLRSVLCRNQVFRCIRVIFKQGTFPNYVFRSFLGFSFGAFLAVLLLSSLVFQVKMSISRAALVCVLLAPFFCLGLAFSSNVRCAAFLMMPQLSSKRGRQALIAFAFILAINGPTANAIYNLQEMAQSLACGQEQSRIAMGRLASAVKQPLITAKKAVGKAMQAVKAAVAKLRTSMSAIEGAVSVIVSIIKSASSWLSSIVNICNRKMGTPVERCYRVFVGAADDCSAHLGPLFSWLCSVVYVASLVCVTMHIVGFFCKMIHYVGDAVTASIKRSASRFKAYMHQTLYVDVEFHHSFNVTMNTGNKTAGSIARDVRADLKKTTEPVMKLYNLTGGILALTWLFVFIKAARYHRRFMTDDRFDNIYITKNLKEADLVRAKKHLECVLPLRPSERRRFGRPTQLRWLPHERKHFARSILFLFMSTFTLIVLLLVDYGFYWLLNELRSQSTFLVHVPSIQAMQLEVVGEGLVSDMFRNISKSLLAEETVPEAPPDFDLASCVPNPMPPDMNVYYRIVYTLIIAWILAIIEPFVLRLRPAMLSYYYPDRAQKRAVWLCAHILRERGGVLRTMKRLVGHRMSQGGQPREPLRASSLFERLKDRFFIFRLLFGGKSQPVCIVCASTPEEPLIKCEAPGCTAVYCAVCYATQENQCNVCGQCMIQLDIPGLELERDSSDEEMEVFVQRDSPSQNITIPAKHKDQSTSGSGLGSTVRHGANANKSKNRVERASDSNNVEHLELAERESLLTSSSPEKAYPASSSSSLHQKRFTNQDSDVSGKNKIQAKLDTYKRNSKAIWNQVSETMGAIRKAASNRHANYAVVPQMDDSDTTSIPLISNVKENNTVSNKDLNTEVQRGRHFKKSAECSGENVS